MPKNPPTNAQLSGFVDRIEKLEYDKGEIAGWIKDVYAEAKSVGFDVKILRKVISIRKKDRTKHLEDEMMVETYLAALGDLADLPLGQAAMKRDGVVA